MLLDEFENMQFETSGDPVPILNEFLKSLTTSYDMKNFKALLEAFVRRSLCPQQLVKDDNLFAILAGLSAQTNHLKNPKLPEIFNTASEGLSQREFEQSLFDFFNFHIFNVLIRIKKSC